MITKILKGKEFSFKPLNLESKGKVVPRGTLHNVTKVRNNMKGILLEMGFEEMPTNRWVESSFWNFDSLFQPQQHPARDAHDTFFMSRPKRENNIDLEYMKVIKNTHENGGTTGSIGYNYNWDENESRTNILRTHTTAVSSKVLYQIAQKCFVKKTEEFRCRKFFSIDRVFRNENLDATHLAEFNQIEGFVIDYDLGLDHLIGVINTFFNKLGITGLRFKPAYNPYTEPSMEIFGYHPGLGKYTEVGNSGIFRPEMLEPMGFPKNVRVIAWGLSLERPTMI